jgi:hypothetical protein
MVHNPSFKTVPIQLLSFITYVYLVVNKGSSAKVTL